MFVDTKQLLRQLSLVNTIIMVESGLRRPADMQGGSHMGLRPVQDLTGLLPVIHLFKGDIFHRCSGDDQSIEGAVFDFIKGGVEFIEMACRGIQ